MEEKKQILKLTNERVWRTYLGGRKLDELHGIENGSDGHFPEEWIASLVSARNVGREHVINEGLSRLDLNHNLTLRDQIEADPVGSLGVGRTTLYGASTGVLVKLIDSSERLTVQVHPDRQQAKRLFHSEYGKTECWHILGCRETEGQPPCVYLGFKEGMTRDKWEQLFESQDIKGILSGMHCFSVKEGDTILVEGGVPHAIGAGCFLMEIQEPTDYTIRVERMTPSKQKVDDLLCHQGLGFKEMFECFHYEGLSHEAAYERWFIPSETVAANREATIKSLVTYENTEYFKMNQLEISSIWKIPEQEDFYILYVLEGNGAIETEKESIEMKQGEQFFVSAAAGDIRLKVNSAPLKILQCFGPRI